MPTFETHSSSLSDAYDRWRATGLGRITDVLEEQLILDLAGSVERKQVLDVGCGDGALVAVLARRWAVVTGTDANPTMLAAARARIKAQGSEAMLREGDATVLPFPDESFDIVTAVTVLCFVAEADRAIAEMARVLRPGGRLVIGELGRYSLWAARRRVAGWLGDATWRAARFRPAADLRWLIQSTGLRPEATRGAVFYPPCGTCARFMAPVDCWLGRRTTAGAAFIAVQARKAFALTDGEHRP